MLRIAASFLLNAYDVYSVALVQRRRFEGSVLVGADGAYSFVRRRFFEGEQSLLQVCGRQVRMAASGELKRTSLFWSARRWVGK
eukprot:6173766-Pleurochrysis_carterae.AAC.2